MNITASQLIDEVERKRRKDLVNRAASGVKFDKNSEVGRGVEILSDLFISGKIDQPTFIGRLKIAVERKAAS